METSLIKSLKKGDFFKRKESAKKVYTKQDYDRDERKYICHDESDISNFLYLKGDTKVFIGFDY